MEVRIPHYNLKAFERKLKKVNSSLQKLNLSPLKVTITEDGQEEEQKTERMGIVTKFFKVAVDGDIPLFNGWKVLARITHFKEEERIKATDLFSLSADSVSAVEADKHGLKRTHNLVHTFVPADLRDRDWWLAAPVCDHCRQNRYRKTSYILENSDDGKRLQVGSSCVKEFLDFQTARDITRFYQLLGQIERSAKKAFATPLQKYSDVYVDLSRFLAIVASGKTGSWAYQSLKMGTAKEPEQKHWDEASRAMEFVENAEEDSGDMSNYKSILRARVVGKSSETYVASGIIWTYRRYLAAEKRRKEREERANQTSDSGYIGTPGDRVTLNVKFLSCTAFGTYGYHAITMDADGNVVVGFSKKDMDELAGRIVEYGDSFKVSGIVKDHRTWDKQKQTALRDWKVVE